MSHKKDYTELAAEILDGEATQLDANVAQMLLERLGCKDITRSVETAAHKGRASTPRHSHVYTHPAFAKSSPVKGERFSLWLNKPLEGVTLEHFRHALQAIFEFDEVRFSGAITGDRRWTALATSEGNVPI